MLNATNPLRCPGIPDDAEWVDFGDDFKANSIISLSYLGREIEGAL